MDQITNESIDNQDEISVLVDNKPISNGHLKKQISDVSQE